MKGLSHEVLSFIKNRDKAHVDNRGYRSLSVTNEHGKKKKVNVAKLVLFTFVGAPQGEKRFACHGEGGQLDDSLKNVSWETPSHNNKEDKRRDGTALIGEKNHKSKLNSLQVRVIRRAHELGVEYSRLAKIFGVSHNAIVLIVKRINWKYL